MVALLLVPAACLLWPLLLLEVSRSVRLSVSGLVVRTEVRRRHFLIRRNRASEQVIPWDRVRSWRLEKRLRDEKVTYHLALRLRRPVQGMIVSPPDEASADATVSLFRRYVPTASGRLDLIILPGERQWRALAVVAITWCVLLIAGYATGALTVNPFQWRWLPLGLLAGPGLPWSVSVIRRGAKPAWLWMGSALVVNLYANLGAFVLGRFASLIMYLQEYRP